MQKDKPLSHKVIKSGAWVFLLRISEQICLFIKLVILARILTPGDFGLMGIAMLTMATVETFTQTGFEQALIQKKGDIRLYINDAWTLLVLRGLLLLVILYFIAPPAAVFFNTPEAKFVIRIIALAAFLRALTNIGIVYFQKELEFGKQFIYELSITFTDFAVAVIAAFIFRNIWALVLGLLAGNIAGVIVSYLIYPHKPHFSLNIQRLKEMFHFGKWILGSNILGFFTTQGDNIIVGKMLGAISLGFYQIAYRISNLPATEITHVISKVIFPAYSKLQDNIPKLKEAYLRVLQSTAFLSFPAAGFLLVMAPDFTRIFLGDKWMPAVPAMRILTLWGLIRSIGATTGAIFQGVGKLAVATNLRLARLILLALLIYPLTSRLGILGTSFAVLLSILPVEPVTFYIVIKIIRCRTGEFLKAVTMPISATAGMITVLIFFKLLTSSSGPYLFLMNIAAGLLTYIAITFAVDSIFKFRTRESMKEILFALSKRGI